jgi:DNA-binding SARP family transcriptional activator
MGLEVRLIGRPEIVDESGASRPVRGYQSWALLARLVLADRQLSRRELSAELFPETVDPLGSLRWCLAGLRRAVGSAEAFSGDPVALNLPAGTRIDVTALQHGMFDVSCAGELLEGIDPRCGAELDTWLLVHRQRIAGLIDAQIRAEVICALSAGDTDRAVSLAEVGVRRSIFDEGAHVLLVKSLIAAGCHDAASTHVDDTETLFRTELGVDATPALRNAARRHFGDAPYGVSARAVAASLLESGRAAIAAGAVDAGLECLRRACDDAERSRDQQLVASCLLELGSALVHSVRSHDDEGALVLQYSADLAEQVGDNRVGTTAHRELGYVDALAGRRPAAASHLEQARRIAGGDADLLAGVQSVNAFNLTDWGRHQAGIDEYREAVDLARTCASQRREVWTLGLGGWAHLLAGDADTAGTWIRHCLSLMTDIRWVAFRPWPLAVLAEVELARGASPHHLRADLEEAFALSCTLADPCWEGATARAIALTYAAAGDTERALEWISQAQHRCLRETDTFVAIHAAILATDCEISMAGGHHDRAQANTRALISLAAKTHMDAHLEHGLQLLGQLDTTPSAQRRDPRIGQQRFAARTAS